MPGVDIFAINFFPEVTGTAPYTTDLVRHLVAADWEVTITTGYPHYPEWRVQKAEDPPGLPRLEINRCRHIVPRMPNAVGRAVMDATWFLTGLRRALRKNPSAATLAVVPNLSGAALALIHARRNNTPLILWVQDTMGQAARQSGTAGGESVARLVQYVETAIAKKADHILIAGESFRSYFVEAGVPDARITRIRNWSLIDPAGAVDPGFRSEHGINDGTFLAVHSGNMGSKQGLEVVLDAAAAAPEILFVLQGDGSEREALGVRARDQGLENLRFLPTLTSDDLAKLLTTADALLLTQRASVENMSLPSKLSTYATTGNPVVASVKDASETAQAVDLLANSVLVDPGDGRALAKALRTLRDRGPTAVQVSAAGTSARDASLTLIEERLIDTAP